MATTTTSPTDRDICKAVLESASDDLVVLSVPGTNYRLHLKPGVPLGSLGAQPGKRFRCRIQGRALRMHVAAAGGRFIEPVYGHPRIVQGTVSAIDTAGQRLLVDVAIPVWFTLGDGQAASEFAVGQMVNMYVESGMTCAPA